MVQETKQDLGIFEESRVAQSSAGPELERLRRRNERAKFEANYEGIATDLESQKPGDVRGTEKSKFTPQIMQLQAKAVQPDLTQVFVLQDMRFGMNRQADINSLRRHVGRDAGTPMNHWNEGYLGSIEGVHYDYSYWNINIVSKPSNRTSYQSPTTCWR